LQFNHVHTPDTALSLADKRLMNAQARSQFFLADARSQACCTQLFKEVLVVR
jgi:hypothetical protein